MCRRAVRLVMELKRTVIVALATAAAVAVVMLLVFYRPASTPIQPQACPDQAVVYVYATEEQKKFADTIVADLKMMLQQRGVNIVNVPMCTLPAQSFPWKLQVYPAILIRGDVSVPPEYVSRTLDGYRELYPLVSLMLAHQMGVALFSYAGEAVLVPSAAPFANISVSTLQQAKEFLSWLFVVNVTQVSSSHDAELASRLSFLPGIVVKSSYNLTLGAPYIVEVAPGAYALAERFQRAMLQYLGVFAYEVKSNPLSGLEDGVPFGAGTVTLYLLEDYHCPFCAKFINSSGELLSELAREGRLRVVFLDLVVHAEVAPVHAFARCLFNLTGSADLYFDLTRELYRALLSGKQVALEDAVSFARIRVPQDVVNASLACSRRLESEVLARSRSLQGAGFTGTPTFIFWNDLAGRGLLLEGCIDVNACITREDFLRILEWLRGG